MSARRVVTSQTEVQSLHEEVAERYKVHTHIARDILCVGWRVLGREQH